MIGIDGFQTLHNLVDVEDFGTRSSPQELIHQGPVLTIQGVIVQRGLGVGKLTRAKSRLRVANVRYDLHAYFWRLALVLHVLELQPTLFIVVLFSHGGQ